MGTGTGALFSGTGGTHVILAGGTAGAVAPVAAVAGAAILLKAGALLHLSQQSRKKRSAEENDAIFTTIAAAEPASCVKQLICDIATGTKPSENDIILSLFNNDTPVTSPKFDFAVAYPRKTIEERRSMRTPIYLPRQIISTYFSIYPNLLSVPKSYTLLTLFPHPPLIQEEEGSE